MENICNFVKNFNNEPIEKSSVDCALSCSVRELSMSRDSPHFLSALAASCVFYNRTEHS